MLLILYLACNPPSTFEGIWWLQLFSALSNVSLWLTFRKVVAFSFGFLVLLSGLVQALLGCILTPLDLAMWQTAKTIGSYQVGCQRPFACCLHLFEKGLLLAEMRLSFPLPFGLRRARLKLGCGRSRRRACLSLQRSRWRPRRRGSCLHISQGTRTD